MIPTNRVASLCVLALSMASILLAGFTFDATTPTTKIVLIAVGFVLLAVAVALKPPVPEQ